ITLHIFDTSVLSLGDCDVPPRFNFAELKEEYRNQNTFAVGKNVEYNCRPGYTKVYKSTLRCMSHSQWSDTSSFFLAKSCPHPGEPENGRLVILTDLMFGATVNFICEEGYRLIGDAERKCVLEGSQVTWDKEIPYCQVIPCRPPPEIEHGTHTGTTMEEFNYGTSVTYQCNTVERGQVPFSLIGEPSIHCTSKDNVNGDWSGPAPKCKVIHCEQPKVDHGKQMTGYSPVYTYRASVLFECEHRYTLKGNNILQCNENSRWDPQLPVCERSSCDDPPYIHNAVRMTLKSNLFPAGTVVKYGCERGYELIPGLSSASVTCQKDFTWSEHQEFCQRISCPYPTITNGRASAGKDIYVYEEEIRIQCDSGYALKGNYGWSKCEHNGAWHPALPVCEPEVRCPAPDVNNGTQMPMPRPGEETYAFGDSVTIECDLGYDIKGSINGNAQIRCKHDGTWDPAVPVCEPGQYKWWRTVILPTLRVFVVGSSITYKCDRGFSLVGNTSIQCIAGDEVIPTWSEPTPQCEEVRCPAPDVKNGQRTPRPGEKTYAFGESVTIECDFGYGIKGSINGNAQIRCKHDGTWDSPVPVCEPGQYKCQWKLQTFSISPDRCHRQSFSAVHRTCE
uniref:Complement component 4 binding protein alpha n=1 Tax=Chelydra serpentina TaxID=8475 RepID=A0A8C3RPS5_CHESE